MLSKLLFKTLSKIYSAENAIRFTILLISLISVATILICFPSLKLFMQGKPLAPIHVIFFAIIGYVLYELFSCIKLQSSNENKEQNLVTVSDKKQEVIINKSYLNLKDTFIFHEKKDYKILDYLKRYESHLTPPDSGANKKEEVDISNIIGNENENDDLDVDVMDQMSEKDLNTLREDAIREVEKVIDKEKEVVENDIDMNFLGQEEDFEVDLEELKKAQEMVNKSELDTDVSSSDEGVNMSFLGTEENEDTENYDPEEEAKRMSEELSSSVNEEVKNVKNRAEQKFDLMGDIGNLISKENENNS